MNVLKRWNSCPLKMVVTAGFLSLCVVNTRHHQKIKRPNERLSC